MTDFKPKDFKWNYCNTCGGPLNFFSDGEKERPYCSACQRHYYDNPVPACCIFIRDTEDRLLFGKRAVEPCRGAWALPGGFMEAHETGEECVFREMAEETNLCGEKAQLLGVSSAHNADYKSILVLGYLVHHWTGIIKPDSDVDELRFFARHERPFVPFEAHRELITIFDRLYP